MRPVTVIGAATSAGSHHAGQERAPDALRAAGLIEHLIRAGITVTDHGNVVRETFRVDAGHRRARNLAATVRAAQAVADAVEFAARDGSLVLVLGGDCTITLGVLAGLQRVEPDAGLAYFDGDADLGTPEAGSGILDAMGIAHLLGLAETELTGRVLSVLFAAPGLSTVVLTEVNPSYDPSGDSLNRYLEAVTGALITGLAG